MSAVKIELEDYVLKRVNEFIKKENISLEKFIEFTLIEKVSAVKTLDTLEKRAKRGSKEKFLKVLSKVPAKPPLKFDRLKK